MIWMILVLFAHTTVTTFVLMLQILSLSRKVEELENRIAGKQTNASDVGMGGIKRAADMHRRIGERINGRQ